MEKPRLCRGFSISHRRFAPILFEYDLAGSSSAPGRAGDDPVKRIPMAKILQFDHTKHPFKDVLLRRPKPKDAMPPLAPWEPITVVDLFCGAGGSTSGIVRALEATGRKVNLVSVNHWATACRTMKTNYPDALVFNASVEVVDPRYAVPGGRIDLLVASPECFPAGTLILTKPGLVPIEKIKTGDLVLTHKNLWKRVTGTMKRRKDTVVLRGHGHYGLETTAEHPFLTKTVGRKWNNTRRDYDPVYGDPNWNKAEDSVGHLWATPTTISRMPVPGVPGRGMNFNEHFWWMVGRWLGDGSLRMRERSSEVTICCGKHEGDALEQRLQAFAPKTAARCGKGELRWRRRDVRTATLFETGHDGLANWLKEHFGSLAHKKTIPTWVLTIPREHRIALIEGYRSADGSKHVHKTSKELTVQTVSKSLAVGIRLLLESLGEHVAMYHYPAEKMNRLIERRTVNARGQYRLSWYPENHKGRRHHDDGKNWHTIKEITTGQKNVDVYNFEVEDDNSYVADGIVVHNCIMFSQARGNKKAIREQSRSSAAFIYEWLANPHVYVESFLLENVSEWQTWGPLDEDLRPIKERQGEYFDSFLSELRKLGYGVDHRVLNAADYGDVTSRKRIFVMGRADGEAIKWPEQSHAEKPEKIRGRTVRRWRAAREIIDWTIPGTSIFNRPKGPHAPKTLVRTRAGFAKQDGTLASAYVEALDRFIPIAQDFQDACKAIEARWPGKNKASALARALEKSEAAAVARERSIDAFLRPVGVYENIDEQTVVSMVLGQNGGAAARDAETAPIPTIATKGAIAKFEGIIAEKATKDAIDGFTFPVNHGGGEERTRGYDEILGTFTTKRSDAKADPAIEAITASIPALEPEAFISHMRGYFGEDRIGRTASSTEAPLDTIAASGNHHAVVRAKIVQNEIGMIRPWVLIDGKPYAIDVLFRMLMNKELAHAMSFIDDGHDYEFSGSTQAITRQIGNAVPVRLSKALVGAQLRFYIDPVSRRRGRVTRRLTKTTEVAA